MPMNAATSVAMPQAARPAAAEGRGFNVAAHGLRGVAAMLVFVAHLFGGTAKHIYASDLAYGDAVRPFWNVGGFGVELFFVISGFVIMPSVMRYSLKEFALRRFLRLYPLFFAFSVLFIILNAITNGYPSLNTPKAAISGLFFVNLFTGTEQLTPNAWSLSFEVMFYMAAALSWHFAVTKRNALLAFIVISLSLGFWISFPIATYFVLGVLVRLAHDRGWFMRASIAWLPEILMFGTMIWLASLDHYEYHWADMAKPEVWALMLATAVYFMFAVSPQSFTARLLGNRATLWLGTVSYSLYIVHPYVYLPMRLLFDRLGWFTADTDLSMTFFVLAVTPPALLATAIVHDRFERRPYEWFFKQGIYRTRAAEPKAD